MSSVAPNSAGLIAIADDEPENLNVLEDALAQAGYRVAVFPRGDLLLAAVVDAPPDLVLLDVRMPGLNGYDVCQRFKADARLAPIPIIFISALTGGEDITAGFACGAVDYITKPFRQAEVLARVRTHIALCRAHAELVVQHAELQVLERHRDTLVHMIVHDMRSPLHVLLGYLEIVEESSTKGPLSADDCFCLHAAIDGAAELSRMVSTVIDSSRLESAELPLRLAAVTVRDVLQTACAQALTPVRRQRLVEQIADPCPRLHCDAALTARIVANLLGNALKYAPGDSEIVFGATPAAGGVRLWVRDHGPGIPASYHQQIFEKFGVVAAAADLGVPSTGLGLAFCKLAVAAQGGSIGVESAPGQGSTFWFTIPAAAGDR